MKTKLNSIRSKLILTFFICATITVIFMTIVVWILVKASYYKPFAVFFLDHAIFFIVVLFLVTVSIPVFCFLFLTKRKMRYFEEIHQSLRSISEGDLDTRIPVKGSDELYQLADTINEMTVQLKLLIEEEKKWEQAKKDIVTSLSHDLRTPLTSTLGYIELINQGKYKDEETLKRYSEIAYSKCKNLKVLVDDLFEYSKLNSVGLTINRISINLAELLEQVILGFIPVLDEAEMSYEISFPKEKISVSGDPLLLARLFDNLINNAVHYGKEGKRLDVELEQVNKHVVVRIINGGNPISEDELQLVFERFYKCDKSRSQYTGGSGIGLAIVKSIVKLHRGTVKAESENEKTIFEVRLPL